MLIIPILYRFWVTGFAVEYTPMQEVMKSRQAHAAAGPLYHPDCLQTMKNG
jgi:hypothetical protein